MGSVKKKTHNPVWNETFTFLVYSLADEIELRLMNQRPRDGQMGRVSLGALIDLFDWSHDVVLKQTHKWQDKNFKSLKRGGVVTVEIGITNVVEHMQRSRERRTTSVFASSATPEPTLQASRQRSTSLFSSPAADKSSNGELANRAPPNAVSNPPLLAPLKLESIQLVESPKPQLDSFQCKVEEETFRALRLSWEQYVGYIESISGVRVSCKDLGDGEGGIIIFTGTSVRDLWCAQALYTDLLVTIAPWSSRGITS